MRDRSLPDGWCEVTLAECVQRITSGATPKVGNKRYYEGGTIPFARIDDVVRANGGRLDGIRTLITDAAINETAVQVYPPETVLITMYGTIGASAMTAVPTATNQAIAAFLGPRLVEPKYLLHLLAFLGPGFTRLAGQTTQANISGQLLKRIHVDIPASKQEQRRIAEVLDAIDAAIDKTEAVIAATERLRSALLAELLSRGLPGWHTEWEQVPGIGTIPACWGVVRLGDVANVRYGLGQPPAEAGGEPVAMIRATNINRGKVVATDLLWVGKNGIPMSRDPFLRPGEIVVVRSGAYTGDSALITDEWAGAVAGYDLVISPSAAVNAVLLTQHLLGPVAQRYFGTVRDRSAQPHLNAKDVAETPVPLPSLNEQSRIAASLGGIDARITVEVDVRDAMQTAKSSMAAALLSGQVRLRSESEASHA